MRTRTKLYLAACLAALVALVLPAAAGAKTRTVTTKTTLTFSAPGPTNLPAMGSAGLYPWNLFAFALAGKTTSIEVTLNGLTHERVSDLDALLVAPNGGRNVMFMSDIGDGTDIPPPGVNLTFKDGANTNAPINTPLKSGTYRPTNGVGSDPDAFASPAPSPPYGTQLSRVKGQDPNGLWSLYLTDDNGDVLDPATGSVSSYAIKINSQLKTKIKTKTKKRKKRGCKRFKNKKKRKKCQRKRKRR